MDNNFEHTYECEDCGGVFIIHPELEEEIVYCPQCGCDNPHIFKKINTLT